MFAFVSSALPLGTSSFVACATTNARVAPASVSKISMMAEKSKSIPFLDRPAALDGKMVGDVGFDPLNLSSLVNLKFLREAELKHGRICMLAALGMIVTEFFQFPFYSGAPTLSTAAHDYFAKAGVASTLGQVAIFVSFFEIVTTPAVIQMCTGSDREPGYFAFDPLGLGKNPDTFKKYQLNELKNGRLAMIAVGGMIHQAWLTNMGPIEQLTKGKFLPF